MLNVSIHPLLMGKFYFLNRLYTAGCVQFYLYGGKPDASQCGMRPIFVPNGHGDPREYRAGRHNLPVAQGGPPRQFPYNWRSSLRCLLSQGVGDTFRNGADLVCMELVEWGGPDPPSP